MANIISLALNTHDRSIIQSDQTDAHWSRAERLASDSNAAENRYGSERSESLVQNWLLRDRHNKSSIYSLAEKIRENTRQVRSHLSGDVASEANEMFTNVRSTMKQPLGTRNMTPALKAIRQGLAMFLSATDQTLARSEVYDFARIGQFTERADFTLRVIESRYYTLLPSATLVGSSLDNQEWSSILEDTSSVGVYRSLYGATISPIGILNLLFRDQRAPRSVFYCCSKIQGKLQFLESDYSVRTESAIKISKLVADTMALTPSNIVESGLHELCIHFLEQLIDFQSSIYKDFNFVSELS